MLNFKKIILSFLLCFGVAYLGSMVTLPSIENWYIALTKPVLNPPNWVFGPVWTILYSLMAVSLAIVWSWEGNTKQKKLAITFFLLQLILNFFWSFLFFIYTGQI
jgi:translocator protein